MEAAAATALGLRHRQVKPDVQVSINVAIRHSYLRPRRLAGGARCTYQEVHAQGQIYRRRISGESSDSARFQLISWWG